MERPIFLIISIIIFLLFALLILCLYLVIRKAFENYNRNKIDSYKEEYRNTMFLYLYKGEQSRHLLPDSDVKYDAIEELLNEFANVVEGEELEKRMTSFADQYFLERYKKDLLHRRWSKRMNALYNIESFQMKSLLVDVVKVYDSKKKLSEAEVVQMLKLMVKFDHPDLFSYITSTKYEVSEFVYRLLFSKMSEQSFNYFVAKYDKLSYTIKLTILDIIGIENRRSLGGFLESQLKQGKDEIRIRSLKALASLSVPLPIERMKQHLHSTNFEERTMAIKVCATTRKKEYIPLLVERMADSMFVVRQQAGNAIYRYPNGLEILKDILDRSSDDFARDMAKQWLEKGNYNGIPR